MDNKNIEAKLKRYEDQLANDGLSDEDVENMLMELDKEITILVNELQQKLQRLNDKQTE